MVRRYRSTCLGPLGDLVQARTLHMTPPNIMRLWYENVRISELGFSPSRRRVQKPGIARCFLPKGFSPGQSRFGDFWWSSDSERLLFSRTWLNVKARSGKICRLFAGRSAGGAENVCLRSGLCIWRGMIRWSSCPTENQVFSFASYLVDPASSHMLVSKIKPCMSKYKPH